MSILASAAKASRIAALEANHAVVNTKVTSSPQTAAQIAAAAPSAAANAGDATRKLSVLVDEGLAARSAGDPNTATYTLA